MTDEPITTPRYRPLMAARHQQWRVMERESFADVADQAIMSLYAVEYPWAAAEFPIGFWRRDAEAPLSMVAVLSPVPGSNCMVTEKDKWLGDYIPALLRQVPFSYADHSDGSVVLCIDELSPCLSETEGEALFTPEGMLSPYAERVKRFMHNMRIRSMPVLKAMQEMDAMGLIIPWEQNDNEEDKAAGQYSVLTHLLRVDMNAVQQLPEDDVLTLHKSGGLSLAHAQHFSTRRVPYLQRMAMMAKLAGKANEDIPVQRSARLYREEPEGQKGDILKDDPLDFNFF